MAPGDRIEIKYVVRGRKGTGLESAYWAHWYFDGQFRCLRNRLTIITPVGLSYNFKAHGAVPEATSRTQGEWQIRQWDMSDIEPINVAAMSIPSNDMATWLDISTVAGWEVISRWYSELSSERCVADKQSRTKALKLTQGVNDEREKVRRLRDFLARDLRYQTTPFRNSAFIPTEGSKVLEEGYGDCKDKAALLKAMLAELDIESHLVLVSGRDRGTQGYLPSPRFNHAINLVKTSGGPLWVDATTDLLSFDLLHRSLYGVQALVINEQTEDLVTIEPPPAERDYTGCRIEARLTAEGDVEGEIRVEMRGNPAGTMRSALLSVDQNLRQQGLLQVLPTILPEAEARKVEVEALEDYDQPLVLVYSFARPSTARAAGSFLVCEPLWSELTRPKKTLNSLRNKVGPLEVTGLRGHYTCSTTLTLPSGWELAEAPAAKKETTPFGRFELKSVESPGQLELRVDALITPMRVDGPQGPKFLEFLKSQEDSFSQPLLLKKSS